ncbi:MAG: transcriptional repressor [Dehalococcoidia bacterium]|nr:MAG: transcriptional repressor [Dehalococcoidia bacterium]
MKRNTSQRDAIRRVIVQADRPLSTDEIFDMARNRIASLGIATVYRTLKSLKEEGAIHEVDIPGKSSRWELADKDHHHHFLCRNCDKLYEVEGCLGGIDRLLPPGYSLEAHNILLEGKCRECRMKPKG